MNYTQYLKTAFNITKDMPVLTIPPILYLLMFVVCFPYIMMSKISPAVCILAISLFMLAAAVFSGWFNMIKTAISRFKPQSSMEEKYIYLKELKKNFIASIASDILPMTLTGIIYLIFFFSVFFFAFKLCTTYIGSIEFFFETVKSFSAAAPANPAEIVKSFTQEQMVLLGHWELAFFTVFCLFSIFTMYIAPIFIYETKNPVKVFFKSVLQVILHPILSLQLFFFLASIWLIIMLLNGLFGNIWLILFILWFITIYLLVFTFVLIFLWYKEKIGKIETVEIIETTESTENISNNGSDSDGQE